MNNHRKSWPLAGWCVLVMGLVLSSVLPFLSLASTQNKLKPQDIVARHLESIGSVAARDAARNRTITGTALFVGLGRQAPFNGGVRFASNPDKSLISMVFGSADYPYEKLAFDGAKMTTSYLKPGLRTLLGRQLATKDVVLREGILGGTLSAAWPLMNLSARNPKLQYDGLKKVAGRQLHQLRYTPLNDSEMRITLFFEPEIFRHVRTEYSHTVPGQAPAYNSPAPEDKTMPMGYGPNRTDLLINLIESFSDFIAEGGLTLPHSYKLELEIRGPNRPLKYEWNFSLKQFTFGQPVDDREFELTAN